MKKIMTRETREFWLLVALLLIVISIVGLVYNYITTKHSRIAAPSAPRIAAPSNTSIIFNDIGELKAHMAVIQGMHEANRLMIRNQEARIAVMERKVNVIIDSIKRPIENLTEEEADILRKGLEENGERTDKDN